MEARSPFYNKVDFPTACVNSFTSFCLRRHVCVIKMKGAWTVRCHREVFCMYHRNCKRTLKRPSKCVHSLTSNQQMRPAQRGQAQRPWEQRCERSRGKHGLSRSPYKSTRKSAPKHRTDYCAAPRDRVWIIAKRCLQALTLGLSM